jgi:hypothetical protein
MVRVLRALLASGMLVFAIAVPALANDLHQTVPTGGIVAGDFDGGIECDSATVPDGQILWHFIHATTDSSDLPSTLTATFSDGSTQTVDGYVNGNSVVMYDVYTAQGVNLTGASDTAVGDGSDADLLNLSHTCTGAPPPEVPEAPIALLLPLMALAVLGGYLLIQRRRSSSVI